MGALIIILPVLAFDIWLLATTGRKQCEIWIKARAWRQLGGLAAIGVVLAVVLAFVVEYKWGVKMRVTGFPIPDRFESLDAGKWTEDSPQVWIHYAAVMINLVSGFVVPFIPFKVAEFLRAVKAEL